MSSILTNASALTALQSLNATNKNLATTQSRISTGMRVAEASDNAAYWSIATTMRSDNKANSAVQDALGLGAGKVDTAYTAVNDIIEQVDKLKAKLVSAMGASQDDQKKIATEISSIQAHIKSSIDNANYAGSNLLKGATTAVDLKIVASYNRDSTGGVTVDTIDLLASETNVVDDAGTGGTVGGLLAAATTSIFDPSTAVVDDTAITTSLGTVESALSGLATTAAKLGAAKSRIDMQKSFVTKLTDSIDRGVGQLVDADMNKESTRLQALQVQQQLGIQALSIANGNSQSILSLFRG